MKNSICFMKISSLVLYVIMLVFLVAFGGVIDRTALLFFANLALANLCWMLLVVFVWGSYRY